MMNRIKWIVVLCLVFSQYAFAQTKMMTLEDAIIGKNSYLREQSFVGLKWANNTHFSYIKDGSIWSESVKSGLKTEVVNIEKIDKQISLNLGSAPAYEWINTKNIKFTSTSGFVIYDVQLNKITNSILLKKEAENAEYDNNSKKVAYTIADDLFVKDIDGEIIQITFDGGNGIVNGKYVHRREFGITDGIFWSPNGALLAFYRKDERKVANYPIVDYMAPIARVKPTKYPMAGQQSHQVKVGVYNFASHKTVFLNSGEPDDHYFTNISWSPDEKYIYVIELNREQNHLFLNKYDAFSGEKIVTLFEEKHPKYVEPQHPLIFSKVNPEVFYYISRKDGWFHYYKYSIDGKLIKQITHGNWEVTNFIGFDANEKFMFFEATKESPIERHLYKVNLKNGKQQLLTVNNGTHSGILSPGGDYLIDNYSDTDIPHKTDIITASGKPVKNVLTSSNPLNGYNLGLNKLVSIKAADGKTDLYGRLILPNNFDSLKKYPVIVYVYGGPHAQLVNKTWLNDARWWQYYMAGKGYISFTLDNRGSANRGLEFENAIFRNLGIEETADQMEGIKYLKNSPFVDESRIGVHGWSYGGFMTLNLLLRHPETFKVGAAGGPVVDWSFYEVMYGERYMDTPAENPEGYSNSNMANLVPELNGKLLLVHGGLDDTVVLQNSIKFVRECIKDKKQVDFFIYPTHPHNVRGYDRLHLMEKISNYFMDNL